MKYACTQKTIHVSMCFLQARSATKEQLKCPSEHFKRSRCRRIAMDCLQTCVEIHKNSTAMKCSTWLPNLGMQGSKHLTFQIWRFLTNETHWDKFGLIRLSNTKPTIKMSSKPHSPAKLHSQLLLAEEALLTLQNHET